MTDKRSPLGIVPAYETCRRLYWAGFPQETVFAFLREHGTGDEPEAIYLDLSEFDKLDPTRGECAAPTLAEVLAEMPVVLEFPDDCGDDSWGTLHINPDEDPNGTRRASLAYINDTGHIVTPEGHEGFVSGHDNAAEAAALLWLALHEAGLLAVRSAAPEGEGT